MTRFITGGAIAALTLAACAVAGSASAQTYDRLVVFGDSLSDNGNLYIATGGTTPASPPFYQGRFSDGRVWTELLGFNATNYMGPVQGSVNMAFGGARTDASVTPPPGMLTQLGMYTGLGGGFGPRDLVTVLGGANDIFQTLPLAGASAAPLQYMNNVTNTASTNINTLVNTVAGAGAGTILVGNLPKLSLTPQFISAGAAAASLADAAAGNFNSTLLTKLNATAAARAGTNIIVMDLFRVGDTVAANPAAFGLTNVTQPCFNGTTVCSNPGSYFYWDGVHPTAKGHQIIASLANDYLYYADRGAQSTLVGETTFRHRENALDANNASLSGRAPWEAGTSLTGTAWADSTDTDARGTVSEANSEGWGGRIALEASGSNRYRIGLAGSAHYSDVDSSTLTFAVESFGLDLYGGWREGNHFVNASVGVSRDNVDDVKRQTGVGPIVQVAKTTAVTRGARLQAGTWFDAGGLALSPRAAVTWVTSDVDGYREAGAAAMYAYGDRHVKAVTAEAAVRAEANLGGMNLFGEIGYRDLIDENNEAVRVGLHANPAKPLTREFDNPFGGQILGAFGLESDVGPLKVSVGWRGRFGDLADSHAGGIQIRLPL